MVMDEFIFEFKEWTSGEINYQFAGSMLLFEILK